jgi:glycosyltransferase involved in cell wall biosynthesis
MRELRGLGHDTSVLVTEADRSCVLDGIEIVAPVDRGVATSLVRWADVVIAQLKSRGAALRLTARNRRPLVFYVHIGGTPRGAAYGHPDLTLFNSESLRNRYPEIDRALVLHPPIVAADYRTEPGDAITLVNMTELKGGSLFLELADRLPGRSFLGVEGWGAQVVPERIPANVTVLPTQSDMRAVYGKTRILLMPSSYERYGRVGLEAAVSGIPTIAHPLEGVREALGEACLWADRDDVDAWIAQIEGLDDPATYARRSAMARRRFEELSSGSEILELEAALRELASGTGR